LGIFSPNSNNLDPPKEVILNAHILFQKKNSAQAFNETHHQIIELEH
jgi:hypothetical protein